MASVKNKLSHKKRQPAVGRLSARVKSQPAVKSQRRDKYGRFVKSNKLGISVKNPARLRDSNGRFISQATAKKVYRDKRGRFTKPPLPWHKRKLALSIPVTIGLAGIIIFGSQLYKPISIEEPVAAQEQISVPELKPLEVTAIMPKSMPTRLIIPKISVDTSFIDITKKKDGTIEVPSDPFKVGWYDRGPTPGELGPAVVVGHVDRPGGTAIFWRLREMVKGDTFLIERADGSTAKFKVTSVKQFSQSNFPTEDVYGNIDHAGIRLITCGGTFNRSTQKYSHNTVVYGQLVVKEKTATQN